MITSTTSIATTITSLLQPSIQSWGFFKMFQVVEMIFYKWISGNGCLLSWKSAARWVLCICRCFFISSTYFVHESSTMIVVPQYCIIAAVSWRSSVSKVVWKGAPGSCIPPPSHHTHKKYIPLPGDGHLYCVCTVSPTTRIAKPLVIFKCSELWAKLLFSPPIRREGGVVEKQTSAVGCTAVAHVETHRCYVMLVPE